MMRIHLGHTYMAAGSRFGTPSLRVAYSWVSRAGTFRAWLSSHPGKLLGHQASHAGSHHVNAAAVVSHPLLHVCNENDNPEDDGLALSSHPGVGAGSVRLT